MGFTLDLIGVIVNTLIVMNPARAALPDTNSRSLSGGKTPNAIPENGVRQYAGIF